MVAPEPLSLMLDSYLETHECRSQPDSAIRPAMIVIDADSACIHLVLA